MNICLAITNYPPQVGGLSTFYSKLARLLSQQNHHVLILMVDYNATLNEEDEIIGENNVTKVIFKKTYRQLYNKYKAYFRPGGLQAYSWIAMGLAMRNWLLNNHEKFKIEIIQTVDYGGLGFFLADNKLPPVVVFGHGCVLQICNYNYLGNDDHSDIVKKLEHLAFEKADALITHSYVNQIGLIELTGREVTVVSVPWLEEEPIISAPAKNNHIAVISGLQIFKGSIVMAEAMCLLAKKNSPIQLKWIGPDFSTAKDQQSMAEYLRQNYPDIWQKNFLWLGEKSNAETKKEIITSSVIVIPAIWETFNWVALEAASLGKPIIITDNTGAVYLFTHGHDAWIIPANDPKKLAEAIELLKNDEQLCGQLGRNAIKLIQHTFKDAANAQEKISLYQNIIQNRSLQKRNFAEDIIFLNKYYTPMRKIKYQLRALLKKMAGRF